MRVDFAKKGWVVMVAIHRYDGGRAWYPLGPVFTAVKMICDRVAAVKEEMALQNLEVANELVLIPVTFEKALPLRPDYWVKPTVKFTTSHRMDAFCRVLANPLAYKLLVTPLGLVGNEFGLTAAIPIGKTSFDADAELFMKMSDYCVNDRAGQYGVYVIEETLTLNWVTGELGKDQERVTLAGLN